MIPDIKILYYSFLAPTILKLSAIILVFCSFLKNFIHFFIVVAHITLFIALYIAVCLFVYHCVVLFGLMATRLNKHYYYYIVVLKSAVHCERVLKDIAHPLTALCPLICNNLETVRDRTTVSVIDYWEDTHGLSTGTEIGDVE